jgi:AGZA family xanthine/uracil permease-like MFS transporter
LSHPSTCYTADQFFYGSRDDKSVLPASSLTLSIGFKTEMTTLKTSRRTFSTELLAGITTFFTMAYIVIVNPMVLSQSGMDYGAVFVATCLSAALGCFLMGFLANYPIALAPAMSLNVYFTFYVVQQLHYSWQEALGFVFIAGVLFALLTFTQVRQWLIYTLPHSMKMAIAAGIGLFLIIIAFKSLGVHLSKETQYIPQGLLDSKIAYCLLGVILAFLLEKKRIIGSILISMIIITLLGTHFHFVPEHIAALPPNLAPTFLQLQMPVFTDPQSIIVILIFLFITLFDNTGTLIAILHQAHLLPQDRNDTKASRLGKALLADSLASSAGALLGTSSTGSYIESAAGVQAGGRTGLTSIVVGILFLCALFFAPLAKAIPDYAAASALIFVGILMSRNLMGVVWNDYTEYLPALICVIAIPVTFSIADGIAAGFISYIVLKLISGKKNQLTWSFWVLGILCALYFAIKI